jgi:hypothetical protein
MEFRNNKQGGAIDLTTTATPLLSSYYVLENEDCTKKAANKDYAFSYMDLSPTKALGLLTMMALIKETTMARFFIDILG